MNTSGSKETRRQAPGADEVVALTATFRWLTQTGAASATLQPLRAAHTLKPPALPTYYRQGRIAGASPRTTQYFACLDCEPNADQGRSRPGALFGRLPSRGLGLASAQMLIRPNARVGSRAAVGQGAPRVRRDGARGACMDGARGAREKNLTLSRNVRVQPCIRPLNAAVVAAGPDVIH